MIPLSLQTLAEVLDGELRGDAVTISAVSTDSRALPAGALFVALKGDRFDGHDFCATAVAGGACALLVSDWQQEAVPQLKVADTRRALGLLGAYVRQQLQPQTLAITGSCGKTTVKEMCAAILGQRGEVLATRGNLNNDIGVPLTLLRLEPQHQYAVLELGANHLGEIAWTTALVRPQVALINNVAAAHLEGFGSLDGVCTAKSEIFQGLPADGVAIVNADSEFFPRWQRELGSQLRSFALDNATADYRAEAIKANAQGGHDFRLLTPQGAVEISLSVPGRHNVGNALAAAALTLNLGVTLDEVRSGLALMAPVKGRLCVQSLPGLTLIDDTYNASVASVLAAIDTLAAMPGHRVLVFGDMGELGEAAAEQHRLVGAHARQAGLQAVYTVGHWAALTAEAAGGQHFADKASLLAALPALLNAHQDLVLLAKGARSSKMEDIIEFARSFKEQAC